MLEPLLHGFSVGTPAGVDMIAAHRVKYSHVLVSGVKIEVDLIVLDISVYDVIFEMDWLAKNYASIGCYKKEVVFTPPSKTILKFKGTKSGYYTKDDIDDGPSHPNPPDFFAQIHQGTVQSLQEIMDTIAYEKRYKKFVIAFFVRRDNPYY